MEDQRADQHEAQHPQRVRPRQQRHEELAEELAVDVDVVLAVDDAEVHLEVADHVHEHEADADQPGDRHDVLLADGGRVQVDEERLALLRRPRRRAGDRPPADRLRHARNANPPTSQHPKFRFPTSRDTRRGMRSDVIAAGPPTIAARQHGAISIKQLRPAGVTAKARGRDQLRGWARRRRPTRRRPRLGRPTRGIEGSHTGALARRPSWVSRRTGAGSTSRRGTVRSPASGRARCPRSRRGRELIRGRRTPRRSRTRTTVVTVDGLPLLGRRPERSSISPMLGSRDHGSKRPSTAPSRSGKTAPLVLERRLVRAARPRSLGCGPARLVAGRHRGEQSVLERRFLALMRHGGLPRS